MNPGDPLGFPEGKIIEPETFGNRKIPLSPWRFVARPAYAPHHGNTGSAKSWGASTPPNSRVRTVGEKLGIPHPRVWFFNASESDLSDGHLIFARDRVEFFAFLTFRAMPEIWIFARQNVKKKLLSIIRAPLRGGSLQSNEE